MWIFTTSGFVSAVEDRNDPDVLVVRSRWRADLKRLFPREKILVTPEADYGFRVRISRYALATMLAVEVGRIDYLNFKNACPKERHEPYLRVWTALWQAAQRAIPRRYRYTERQDTGRSWIPPGISNNTTHDDAGHFIDDALLWRDR